MFFSQHLLCELHAACGLLTLGAVSRWKIGLPLHAFNGTYCVQVTDIWYREITLRNYFLFATEAYPFLFVVLVHVDPCFSTSPEAKRVFTARCKTPQCGSLANGAGSESKRPET